ncbi:MAG: hypothetical protein EOO38_01435 [Cytophagaceae bacterium]|nr:MAG: hypothetical protein EOO38_01435 [Cytophagaceae bacterium]
MRNLQLIKDPRQHFGIFWKEKTPDGEVRVAELQESLRELVHRVQSSAFLSRCATVELLPAPVETPDEGLNEFLSNEQPSVGSTSPQKVPGTYWVVPGDLLEVALLACEIVSQQEENDHVESTRLSQMLDENSM